MKTTSPQISPSKSSIIAEIKRWVKKEGPKPEDYSELDSFVKMIASMRQRGIFSETDLKEINSAFGKKFLDSTIQGYGYRKPLGYPGDFRIIDMIYTVHKTSDPQFVNWDKYFHQHAAPKAVRNRKEYFKSKIIEQLIVSGGDPINLLNVASGPGRDMQELYGLIPDGLIKSVCIDFDYRAIKYAKGLNQKHLDQINFLSENIFKFDANEQYDVIWSAGLFDYFDDTAFKYILKKFSHWLKPTGIIIIGNFSPNNPSKDYMELLGDWYLNYRTPDQLIVMALEVGFDLSDIKVEEEEEGVNLFLNLSY